MSEMPEDYQRQKHGRDVHIHQEEILLVRPIEIARCAVTTVPACVAPASL
jgi:hypothetical protein